MLKLIEGGFSSPAHDEIKKAILTHVENGERVFLIVPEQQTVVSEKEMVGFLPSHAPLCFEVTNFTRFANTAFRELGGVAGEYSDKAREALLMWRALTELSPFLAITGGKGEVNSGMVEKALAATAQMKTFAISPTELSDAMERDELHGNERLKTKLSDLSKIMTLYKELLTEKYADAGDDVMALIRKLEENPQYMSSSHVFIEGFTSFTEPQYMLISKLSERCDVTVQLSIAKSRAEAFEFGEVVKTEERLIRNANKAGVQKKLIKVDGQDAKKAPILMEVSNLLWQSFGTVDVSSDEGRIRVFEAADPYEECDFIAADIKRRVMAGNAYSDFAIIARNAEDYAGIIDTALGRANIPSFISKRRDASTFEAIKLIYSALASVRSGFAREDVISYAKCGLCGASMDACDEFELYTEKWQINKRRFTDGTDWNMSPDGYTERKRPESAEKLIRINKTREKIISPLVALSDDIKEAKTVKDHAIALVNFLSRIELEARIAERSEALLALSEVESAEENAGLWKIICKSLDALVETLGDFPIDCKGFENQLKVVISNADIGRIPSYLDEVIIGSADMIRLRDKKHVYLIGVNLGKFPTAPKDTSYFSDKDKITLSALGLSIEDDSETRYARELFSFSRSFAIANDSVTLLYSARSADLTPALPSDVISRIKELSQGKITPIKIASLPPCEKIYTPESLIEHIDYIPDKTRQKAQDLLDDKGYGRNLEISAKDISNEKANLSKETRDLIYPGDIPLTQTRIDAYLNCPFAYFLKYDLKLSDDEPAKFDARNIGSFIHAVLENFFEQFEDGKKSVTDMTQSEKEELIRDSAIKYVDKICEDERVRTKRMEILIEKLCRSTIPIIEGLCDEMRDCKFIPKFFELPISSKDDGNPSPAVFESEDHNKIYVYGKIDRVDTYKSGKDVYVRVIDYKTGNKDFSPDDLDEGRNLQMFLYLKSLVDTENAEFLKNVGVEEGGRLIPAGVIYVNTDISDSTIEHSDNETAINAAKKKQTRRGMILNNEESIAAMNKNFIPVKMKNDGTPDSRSVKYLYTDEGWDEIVGKLSCAVKGIYANMKSGEISPIPDSADVCSYCKFKAICRKPKK